ncbi:uncharacterized protein [Argopecten irradians]|uniref:uncharacterized protein n=1 Tax=Argopecten irradians TaxID=31199 RepID=UPI0037171290
MAKTKTTSKNPPQTNKTRLTCLHCTTTVGNLSALRRHMKLKHSANPTRYTCNKCHKSYCRIDTAKNHVKKSHPEGNITVLTVPYNPQSIAKKPMPWKPPPEACTNKQLRAAKFRVVQDTNRYTKETTISTTNTLEEDLAISDSESNTTLPEDNHPSPYKYSDYVHEETLDSTFCQDEKPPHLWNATVAIYSVYGIFEST